MYERSYTNILTHHAQFFPVTVLCGARQSGKTTLLTRCFPQHNYVSLDLPSTAELAEKDPATFFKLYKTPLIIDEVQYAPGLFRHLKRLVDENRHQMGQYILTGSQKFNLMKEVSESLAGRAVILDLENLSWQEISSGSGQSPNLEQIIRLVTRGQFPELWRVPEAPGAAYHRSYLSSYLERDVRQILNVNSLRDFERFIRALAPRSGQLLNKTDLARDVGVSVKAINDWLSVLEASNQIVLLEPWFPNVGKRMVKTPKVYFCDTGLLSWILGIKEDNFLSSPFKGQLWETLVFAELRKCNTYIDQQAKLWFYRDQTGCEVDFLVDNGGIITPIEVKWTENPDIHDGNSMKTFASNMDRSSGPWRVHTRYIISTVDHEVPIDSFTRAIPLSVIPELLN